MDVNTLHCLKCPQHSVAESEGSTTCTCENGHYRAPEEGPQVACTRKSCSQGLVIWQQVLGPSLGPELPELTKYGDPGSRALIIAAPCPLFSLECRGVLHTTSSLVEVNWET